MRLDAFESYVKGVTAATAEQQIQGFQDALRLSPNYPPAALQLGKAYYREAEYEQAFAWLSRILPANPHSGEANFYLGLAAYYQGDFPRAEAAFDAVAQRLPLPEIYNNLGVVLDHSRPQARRGELSEGRRRRSQQSRLSLQPGTWSFIATATAPAPPGNFARA